MTHRSLASLLVVFTVSCLTDPPRIIVDQGFSDTQDVSADPGADPNGPDGDPGDAGPDLDPGGSDATDEGGSDACVPTCAERECGDDGCGGECGTCTGGKSCQAGACACLDEDHKACCGSGVCWFDSCGVQGNKTADCPNGCAERQCLDCAPQCDGKACGDDGCGGECGTCAGGMCDALVWTAAKTCVSGQCSGGGTTQVCDDGRGCTTDTCAASSGCSNVLQGGFCLIGGACQVDEQTNPSNTCQVCTPSKSTTAWSGIPDGTTCQAAVCSVLTWTAAKTCMSGLCAGGGTTQVCDDGRTCTTDTCSASAGCNNSLQPGLCLIGGACFADAQKNPSNVCQVCTTAKTTSAWSNVANGTSCGLLKGCYGGECVGL